MSAYPVPNTIFGPQFFGGPKMPDRDLQLLELAAPPGVTPKYLLINISDLHGVPEGFVAIGSSSPSIARTEYQRSKTR